MGLDMYAFAVKAPGCHEHDDCLKLRSMALRCTGEEESVDVDVDSEAWWDEDDESSMQIAYWRKHPNLHGWMEKLYRAKGGEDETFNGVTVKVTLADLIVLEADVEANALPHTVGFFFGQSCPAHANEDRAFIAAAREKIAKGYDIYYDSSW